MRYILKQGNAGFIQWPVPTDIASSLDRVEFIFRQGRDLDSAEIYSVTWDGTDTDKVFLLTDDEDETAQSYIVLVFDRELTYKFKPGKFYFDVRAYSENAYGVDHILPIEKGLMLTGLFPKTEVST